MSNRIPVPGTGKPREDIIIRRGPIIDEPLQAVGGDHYTTRQTVRFCHTTRFSTVRSMLTTVITSRDLIAASLRGTRSIFGSPYPRKVDSFDSTFPVVPCHVAPMDKNGFVHTMVPDAFEEDPPTQQGDLKSLDVDIRTVVVPRVRSNTVGNKGREEAVEVEKEEQGAGILVRRSQEEYSWGNWN